MMSYVENCQATCALLMKLGLYLLDAEPEGLSCLVSIETVCGKWHAIAIGKLI